MISYHGSVQNVGEFEYVALVIPIIYADWYSLLWYEAWLL